MRSTLFYPHLRVTTVAVALLGLWLVCLIFFRPSASALQYISDGSDGLFHPTSITTIDLAEDGTFNFTTIIIPSGVRVTFRQNAANTPVYLLATGDITIDGTVSVSGGAVGENWNGGPSGFDGGPGGVPGATTGGNGGGPGGGMGGPYRNPGGGGGFATPGDDGKTDRCVSTPGLGGHVVPYIPGLFHGGSGGGGGGSGPYESIPGGDGGGGGGALYVSTPTTIHIKGSVLANGGGGGWCYTSAFCGTRCGPAGGGSGGFIWIEAETLNLDENGRISCDKGPGGIRSSDGTLTHFGGDGGDGYVLLSASAYQIDGEIIGVNPACDGDFDDDGDVDGSDLAALASDLGLLDLPLFAEEFGRTNCAH